MITRCVELSVYDVMALFFVYDVVALNRYYIVRIFWNVIRILWELPDGGCQPLRPSCRL